MSDEILNQLDKVTKSRRKGVDGKKKGKRGESWFAEELSKISGHNFQRIYTSGASVGKSNSDLLKVLTQGQAEAQLGDIQSPENLKHYFVWESKNYADLDFHNLLNPGFSSKVVGWLNELEYDLQSGFTKMKANTRPIVGFLLIKITRKGSWIVGNKDYLLKIFGKFNISNHLVFYKEPNDVLQNFGFGNEYFLTDFRTFCENNKDILFNIDSEREEKLKKAKEAFDKIYNED